uniref:Uncharacterized protein n=1 Tax=Glossina palpalis gambiensis TaxID=67801 RepID=A0A1B0C5B3_9MUSC
MKSNVDIVSVATCLQYKLLRFVALIILMRIVPLLGAIEFANEVHHLNSFFVVDHSLGSELGELGLDPVAYAFDYFHCGCNEVSEVIAALNKTNLAPMVSQLDLSRITEDVEGIFCAI